MCTMAINNQFNGIELTFTEKPSEAIRATMKNAGFRWHGQKKLWYAKNTVERMALAQKLSGATSTVETAPAPVPTQAIISKYGLKVGDILYDVWGYSMTLVEYYKVTKILSPSKIEIVEVGHTQISANCGGEEVLPDSEKEIGERLVKQVIKKRHGDGWYVKINDSCQLTPWDGRAHYQNTWD